MKDTVANVLIQLRKQHGFTQSDLADKLGVSFQAVSKWERGENLPDAYTLVALADIYKVTVDEILHGEIKDKDLQGRIKKRKTILFITGITMLILSPISIFLYGVNAYEQYVPMILIIAAIAVVLILYATISTDMLVGGSMKDYKRKKSDEIIYTFCAAIFLLLGFVWGLWHPGWLIFLFGYAVTLIFHRQTA
mgnify:CR=1 FL=1